MHAAMGIGEFVALLFLLAMLALYIWGWQHLRRALPRLATRTRLFAFALGIAALMFALVFPLPDWSNYLLAMRSLQKAMICMIAAPMLWLAAPVQVIRWGLRGRGRRGLWRTPYISGHVPSVTRHMRLNQARLSQPLVTWFVYVAAFLLWHDPAFTPFLLGAQVAHFVAPWLLLGAALLFWWPVVNTGPRFHRTFPAWLFIAYLISVEVLNMVAGMSIAFAEEPIYPYYTTVRAQLGAESLPWNQIIDQIIGGALIWVFGSLVYISSVVFVLLALFRKDGSTRPQPLPHWDDNAKFIAPGLEHRVAQNELRKTDLSHH